MSDNNYWLWTSVLIPILIVWSMIWKGIALWKAGKNDQLTWYIVLFIINTAGILEILYIFVFAKNKNNNLKNEVQSIKQENL